VDPDLALERYVEGGLALFGIEADEAELGVIKGVWAVYRPALERLLEADLGDAEPEPSLDLSRAPAP
jgi:hypothetical protein